MVCRIGDQQQVFDSRKGEVLLSSPPCREWLFGATKFPVYWVPGPVLNLQFSYHSEEKSLL